MDKEVVKIERYGPAIVLPAHFENLVSSVLMYWRRKQSGPKNVEVIKTLLYAVQGERLVTSYGLLQRVMNMFAAAGINVEYTEQWGCRVEKPDYTRLSALREGQDELILALTVNDWGVVEAPTGAGKSFLIGQLCEIYPTSNIIVCSPFAPVTRQTYADLQQRLRPHELGMIGDGRCDRGCRVTCVLDKSLMKCDLEKVDIFIFDEVHRAAAPKTAECLARLVHAKRLGFSASPQGRSDNADAETEALFGPIIAKLNYQDVVEAGNVVPVDVVVVSTAAVPPVNAQTTTALERHGLWRNEHRNGLIVQAVRDLEAEAADPLQILITVETVEHAVFLGKLLPEFTLVYGSMDPEDLARWKRNKMLPEDYEPLKAKTKEELRVKFRAGQITKVIATGTWGTGADFPGLNVVIRADAQSSSILNTQIPGRVTRKSEGKSVGVVVDFDDVFNETLAGRAKKRFTMYRKKGWNITRKETQAPLYKQQ